MDVRPLKKKHETEGSSQSKTPDHERQPNVIYVIGFVLILLVAFILAIVRP